jgi:hypothetical protein
MLCSSLLSGRAFHCALDPLGHEKVKGGAPVPLRALELDQLAGFNGPPEDVPLGRGQRDEIAGLADVGVPVASVQDKPRHNRYCWRSQKQARFKGSTCL